MLWLKFWMYCSAYLIYFNHIISFANCFHPTILYCLNSSFWSKILIPFPQPKATSLSSRTLFFFFLLSKKLITITIIVVTSCHQHGCSGPSFATPLYRPSLPVGIQGYILYQHRAVVCRSYMAVLPLLVHVKRSTGLHLYFSSSVSHVWFF